MASKKKKKKNMITLLSMCAVLVLLIVVYAAASKWKEEPEQDGEEPESGISLAAVKTEDIAEIRVTGELYSYAVAAENNQWVIKGDEEFPLDGKRIDTMAEQLSDFLAKQLVLANAENLEEYGLSTPVIAVEVTKKDGEKISLSIGDNSSADGGYYACAGGSRDVYLIAADTRNAFYLSRDNLMSLDTVPAFTASKAAGLKVVSDTYPSFTIKDSTKDLRDLTAMALYTLALYDRYEKPARVDLTNFSTLMENYASIELGEFTSYYAADAASYGLSSPATALTVWYGEDETETGSGETKEFTLYFGNRTEDESGIYVRLEGSNQIFKMSAETAETLLTPDTFSVLSRYTQMINITILGGLHVKYGDTTRVFSMTHESETQENGGVSTTDYFTVDGKELNQDEESSAFRDLYQAIIGLRIDGELAEGAETDKNAVLSLTFLENDSQEVMHEVRYLPIAGDAGHYAIEENGACVFTADAAQVEEVIGKLREYQP